jgi:hypothetical protein
MIDELLTSRAIKSASNGAGGALSGALAKLTWRQDRIGPVRCDSGRSPDDLAAGVAAAVLFCDRTSSNGQIVYGGSGLSQADRTRAVRHSGIDHGVGDWYRHRGPPGACLGMAKNRLASMVEVTTPGGRREYWAAAVPCHDAIKAVRKMIPADHV